MFVRAIKTVAFNQRDRDTFNTLLALANACASAQKEARQTSATPSFPKHNASNPMPPASVLALDQAHNPQKA